MPFDAKSLLEAVLAGNTQSPTPTQDQLHNLLNQVMQAAPAGAAAAASQSGAGGLGGILGQVLGAAGGQNQAGGGLGGILGQMMGGAGGGQGGLGGILGQVLGGAGGGGGLGSVLGQVLGGGAGGQGGVAGAADIARSIFGNATSGVAGAASATGAAPALDEIIRQISGGPGGADLVAKARAIIAANPAAAGALAGALGTAVVGSGTGRSIAANAAKLGGLVLIGGLAYKAYQNYQSGQAASATAAAPPAPAPVGTGFEAQAQTNDSALLYIRAMVSAAACNGSVDAIERAKITGMLQQVGHGAEAAAFLEQEMANPASIDDLAAAANSPEVALQTYTAARMAVEPHSPSETRFLTQLAAALRLDPALVQHIDAAATANKV